MEKKVKSSARGTRILMGETAATFRYILETLRMVAITNDFLEIFLPTMELSELYSDKAGNEVLNQMYVFPDKKGRELCLRPEGTATVQALVKEHMKQQKDIKLFYIAKCFRYERPQEGRYREFTQFGVEWLNPSYPKIAYEELKQVARTMVDYFDISNKMNLSVKRGLDYYTEPGFEIEAPILGAQKQICGGGPYDNGVGFAFGVDRLLVAIEKRKS